MKTSPPISTCTWIKKRMRMRTTRTEQYYEARMPHFKEKYQTTRKPEGGEKPMTRQEHDRRLRLLGWAHNQYFAELGRAAHPWEIPDKWEIDGNTITLITGD